MRIGGSEGGFNEIEGNGIEGVMDFEELKIRDIDRRGGMNVRGFG